MNKLLFEHKKIWEKKKILRLIYREWFEKIIGDLVPGKTLEIGSGTGSFKEFKQDVITSDIDPQPWLDMHFDAHTIPFKKNTLSNIVLIDTLHHLSDPLAFLKEADRVLIKGGRLILLEPYPSVISLIIYRKFHPEPFNFNEKYLEPIITKTNKHPWESNQAIPYLLFFKEADRLNQLIPDLKIIKKQRLSFLTYPLSGGFENKQLYPTGFKSGLDLIEKLLQPFNSILAFRCYIVLQKD